MLTLNWEIIWTFVNILVLFFLLKFLLFKPVTNMIDKRRKLIEDQLAAAAKSKKEAAEEKQSYAGMIKSANAEADKILKDAKERADQAYQYAMKQAEEDAKARIKQAEKQIEREREQMLQNAKDEVAALASLAAGKLVEKRIDSQTEQNLLDEFIAEAGALQ